jgi:hypothetical protein
MKTCSSLLVGRDSLESGVKTSDPRMVSSGERFGGREGLVFRIGLASGQAVVKHPEQAVEQVALHSGMAVTGVLAPVVVRGRHSRNAVIALEASRTAPFTASAG